ncbi:MAG TPA: TIGR02281 family clan AA aspartic protease [Sphingomicrobium sp.]|nr:TIGR02281 family clan AA aspartic protease [Sphingomicrobium sp.]
MGRALAFVMVVGLLIGFAWPSGEAPAETATAASSGERRETVLEREGNGHFYTHAKVNDDELVEFIVDTGATVVALTVEDAKRLGLDFDPSKFTVVGEGASGLVRGQNLVLDSVEVDGKRVDDVPAVILEGSRLSLLGQAYLSRMGEVEMSGDYMVLK